MYSSFLVSTISIRSFATRPQYVVHNVSKRRGKLVKHGENFPASSWTQLQVNHRSNVGEKLHDYINHQTRRPRRRTSTRTKIAEADGEGVPGISAAMQDRAVAEQIAAIRSSRSSDAGAIEAYADRGGRAGPGGRGPHRGGLRARRPRPTSSIAPKRSRVRDVNSRLVQTLKDVTFSKASRLGHEARERQHRCRHCHGHHAQVRLANRPSSSTRCASSIRSTPAPTGKATSTSTIMDFLHAHHNLLPDRYCSKLFKGGFSTGHGVLREPNDIRQLCGAAPASPSSPTRTISMAARVRVRLRLRSWRDGVQKTFKRLYRKHLGEALDACWQRRGRIRGDGGKTMHRTRRGGDGHSPQA